MDALICVQVAACAASWRGLDTMKSGAVERRRDSFAKLPRQPAFERFASGRSVSWAAKGARVCGGQLLTPALSI